MGLFFSVTNISQIEEEGCLGLVRPQPVGVAKTMIMMTQGHIGGAEGEMFLEEIKQLPTFYLWVCVLNGITWTVQTYINVHTICRLEPWIMVICYMQAWTMDIDAHYMQACTLDIDSHYMQAWTLNNGDLWPYHSTQVKSLWVSSLDCSLAMPGWAHLLKLKHSWIDAHLVIVVN